MFGDFSKPLHHAPYRRRDRRAGGQSAHLREVLRRPTGDRRGPRPAAEKRRALGRQLVRFQQPRLREWLVGLGFLTAALVLFAAQHVDADAELRPFAEARIEYAELAKLLATACAEGTCGVGQGHRAEPPAEMKRLMTRLRVRSASHDADYAQSEIRGGFTARQRLVYDHPGPPEAVALRERRAAWLAERDSIDAARGHRFRPDARVLLGGGWWRVGGR